MYNNPHHLFDEFVTFLFWLFVITMTNSMKFVKKLYHKVVCCCCCGRLPPVLPLVVVFHLFIQETFFPFML
jgi:hypothetical protein